MSKLTFLQTISFTGIVLFLSVFGVEFTPKFKHFITFVGTISQEISELNGVSLVVCSTNCAINWACVALLYSPRMKSCKTLREFLSENFANSSNEAGDWRYYTFQYASSCLELRALVPALSGVYRIYPWRDRQRPLDVFCDMRTDGGGWTVIQRRTYGIPFNRAWNEYKRGFGSKDREYWLGNDLIHALTVERTTSLYIAITLTNGTTLYEQYEQFYITDETDGYRLRIAGNTEGTLGDSLRDDWPPWNVNGMQFSTFDRDNDGFSDGKCSDYGGWWFNQCGWTSLNSDDDEARLWVPTVPNRTLVHGTKMMIR